MSVYERVILKSKAYGIAMKDKKGDKICHTYLIVSEDSVYLKEFSKSLAKLILDGGEVPSVAARVDKGIHPDVMFFGENEKITTSVASFISTDVFVRPYEGDNKIYVLLNLQDASEEAQNKLLKTIEEPPQSSFFILAATQESKLLQTVLSRAKKLVLDLIKPDDIAAMLLESGVDKKNCGLYASCAAGVFSRALKLATDKDFIALYNNIMRCLYKMNSSRDVLEYASIFSAKNIDKNEMADVFMLVVRDLMMIKSGKERLTNFKNEELKLIADGFSIVALQKIIEYCLQLKQDMVYNTSGVASVDQFLLKIVEVKVKCRE